MNFTWVMESSSTTIPIALIHSQTNRRDPGLPGPISFAYIALTMAAALFSPQSSTSLPTSYLYNISNRNFTSGSSCASPTGTDDDRPFEPGSETELTEPECPPPVGQKITRRKSNSNTVIQPLQADIRERRALEPRDRDTSNVELARQAHYQDPADDTDEDLSKVPEDYGKSKNTKELNLRLKERWARYCRTKAIEPSADPKWEVAEDALREASPNDMH